MRTLAALRCGAVVVLLTALPAWATPAAVESPRTAPAAEAVSDSTPASTTPQAASIATVVPGQYIDAQQLRIDNVVGMAPEQSAAAHRTVTVWQINTGRWNGQILDGLSLVLVQNASADAANSEAAIYISDFASAAQRTALLSAISGSHPALFILHDGAYRIEPACIRIEQINGGPLVLHVGLIAMAWTPTPYVA